MIHTLDRDLNEYMTTVLEKRNESTTRKISYTSIFEKLQKVYQLLSSKARYGYFFAAVWKFYTPRATCV